MVLAAVELHLRASSKVEDIYTLPANLTIEHVMPQTWKANWPLLGSDSDPTVVDARSAHIHRLGNLTLTSGPLNSSLSNAAWPAKRSALAESLLRLNHQLAAYDSRDEEQIDARGEQLARVVCELWPGSSAMTRP